MVHTRNSITSSTGWLLLLLFCSGCVTYPLGVRDPVAPTAFPEHDLVPLREQADVAHEPFHGYNATCWRPWPQNWQGCPPQDSGMVIDQNTPLQEGMEVVDETPHDNSQTPTLVPIPIPEDTEPGPEVAEPYSSIPPEPVPMDMMPEISDEGPLSDVPASPGLDDTPGVPISEDIAVPIDPVPSEAVPSEAVPIEPVPLNAIPAEVPTPAIPQEPSQTRDESRAESVAAKAVAAMTTAPTVENASAYYATSNRVDVRFGNVISLVVHDRSIAESAEPMPDQRTSMQRTSTQRTSTQRTSTQGRSTQDALESQVQSIAPFSPERAQPNRLAVFDTEKASSDLESGESAATR